VIDYLRLAVGVLLLVAGAGGLLVLTGLRG
jgi:hypothetical protein